MKRIKGKAPKRIERIEPRTMISLPQLPPEIIIEIFSRLPVKTLLRFKCASKQWCSIISSPHFIKKHLDMSTTRYSRERIIIGYCNYCLHVKVWSVHQPYDIPVWLDCLRNYMIREVQVHGSCSGLVCLSGKIIRDLHSIVISNPSTKESKTIIPWGIQGWPNFTFYGFGYDHSAEDYKVIGILCRERGCFAEKEAGVYALKKRFWRRIQDFPSGVISDDSAKYVKGSLNWAVTRRDSASSWIIISLDLEKEAFSEVPQPIHVASGFKSTLGVIQGCLGILCDYPGTRVDVWVMKEYGVRESWTKLFSIPNILSTKYLKPLLCLKNGEILVESMDRSATLVYDPKENKFKYPLIHYVKNCLEFEESLASPNPTDEISC